MFLSGEALADVVFFVTFLVADWLVVFSVADLVRRAGVFLAATCFVGAFFVTLGLLVVAFARVNFTVLALVRVADLDVVFLVVEERFVVMVVLH